MDALNSGNPPYDSCLRHSSEMRLIYVSIRRSMPKGGLMRRLAYALAALQTLAVLHVHLKARCHRLINLSGTDIVSRLRAIFEYIIVRGEIEVLVQLQPWRRQWRRYRQQRTNVVQQKNRLAQVSIRFCAYYLCGLRLYLTTWLSCTPFEKGDVLQSIEVLVRTR